MKSAINHFVNIRNIGIKSVLAIIGLIVVMSVFYPFILSKLYLTERAAPTWVTTDWILLSGGFFLAVGGAYYNKIADGIAAKFNQKNHENANDS